MISHELRRARGVTEDFPSTPGRDSRSDLISTRYTNGHKADRQPLAVNLIGIRRAIDGLNDG
jgi:hypothetical protein